MTEAATGSVAETSAGNPAPQTTPSDNGSAGGAGANWLSGLSEGNRKLAETKGWTAPEHLDKAFTSYAELERMQGESLRVPKSDAPPEEWEKFHSRLGRPESPDKYEFKRPENLPPDLPYADDLAKEAKSWLHKAGTTPAQAQIIHDGFVAYQAQQMQAAMDAQKLAEKQAVESTHDVLVTDKEWGPVDSEPFKAKLSMANRALEKLGLKSVFQQRGIMLTDGSLTDPQTAKALAAVGEAMFKEDTIGGHDAAVGGENPFKRDANGGRSIGAMTTLFKSDPSRAKTLAKAAGWSDMEFDQWFNPQNPR